MSAVPKSLWRILAKLDPRRSPAESGQSTGRQTWWKIPRHRIVFWMFAIFMTIGIGVCLRAEIRRRVHRVEGRSYPNVVQSGGTLLIAGGGQLSEMIRQRFVELAGGRNARIVVIPAENVDEGTIRQYRDDWLRYDVKSVDVLHSQSRTESNDPEFSRVLDESTGVWLGGGQQTWLAAWYGRTLVESRLKDLLARNGIIGGTSAGAAIMSKVMIASGREQPNMGVGFDLIPGAIIDQHFVKRNRIRRLRTALEQHPDLVGFGIDEGTALQFGVASGRFQVLGQSCVAACSSRVDADGQPSFHIQFLNPGDEFDMERLRRGDAVPPGYVDLDAVLMGE